MRVCDTIGVEVQKTRDTRQTPQTLKCKHDHTNRRVLLYKPRVFMCSDITHRMGPKQLWSRRMYCVFHNLFSDVFVCRIYRLMFILLFFQRAMHLEPWRMCTTTRAKLGTNGCGRQHWTSCKPSHILVNFAQSLQIWGLAFGMQRAGKGT